MTVEEKDLDGAKLGEVVTGLFSEPGRLPSMAEKSRDLAQPGAAERIADVIEETCAAS